MYIPCKIKDCRKNAIKDGYCETCYSNKISEKILEQQNKTVELLQTLISTLLSNQPTLQTTVISEELITPVEKTFIPTIESTDEAVHMSSDVTVAESNDSQHIDKLKTIISKS
jgi:hypothetical protein